MTRAVFAALLLALLSLTSACAQQSRSLSVNFAAPRDWPVIHATTFNGVALEPIQFRTDDWIDDISFGGGLTVVARVPGQGAQIEVRAQWIEWETGQMFEALLPVTHGTESGTLFIRFARDGALSAHRPGAALREGGLGRQARLDDYEEIARICGTPLPESHAEATALKEARRANQGVDPERIKSSPWPRPGPSFCSGK